MDKNKIEVTLNEYEEVNKCIPIIRKYTRESISEIKTKIIDNLPILDCYYINEPDKLVSLLESINKIEALGVKLEIVQKTQKSTRIISSKVIKNLIERDNLIEKQIQEYDDETYN
ncbi:hypothetical protein HCJ66_08090 [Listeria sp. FSL L7-1582]|uniref:hypothetical protein n=1 Tax=Listeria portnoyi TaxID=2713504 RepID=UPI00164DCE08|nr:hypothetical protein [Listeria portnoyi]MBC6309514.1 hypothetical protein [Listeria portnoyi]